METEEVGDYMIFFFLKQDQIKIKWVKLGVKNRAERREGWAQTAGHAWASHLVSSGCFSHLTSKELTEESP